MMTAASPTTADGERGDTSGAKLGMWLFLFTEIILFGGLFLLYAMFRSTYPNEFHHAGSELNVFLGSVNTVLLLTSSLTMVLSISAMEKGQRRSTAWWLALTIVFGLVFLTNKYHEWGVKFHHGIYPGGPELLKRPGGEIIFFGLYFIMTGLHGLHVIVGIVLLSVMAVLLAKGKISGRNCMQLENAGLYWHLVDLIWIFLFPLFYLIV